MPYNSRDPKAASGTSAWQLAIPRSVAVLVLVALVALFALRHVFGSITVAAGTS